MFESAFQSDISDNAPLPPPETGRVYWQNEEDSKGGDIMAHFAHVPYVFQSNTQTEKS